MGFRNAAGAGIAVLAALAACLPVRADQIEYGAYGFSDNSKVGVATTAFSLVKTLFEKTRLMLDVELDQTTIPPLEPDGFTGASRPARQSKSAFLKNRGQVMAGVQRDLFSNTEISATGYFSQEVDYRSISAIGGLTQSFAEKNFIVAMTAQYLQDSVGEILDDGSLFNRGKEVHKAALSLTQLLSPVAFVRAGLDGQRDHGFLSDPYRKIIRNGDTIPERVPSMRWRGAAWVEYSRFLKSLDAAWSAEYRYAFDDWNLKGHMAWLKFHKYVATDWIVSAQYRYSIQGGIDFGEYAAGDPGVYSAPGDPKLRDGEYHLVGIGATFYLRAFARNHPTWDFLRGSSVTVRYVRYFSNGTSDVSYAGNLPEIRLRFEF